MSEDKINKYIIRLFRADVPFVFPELDEEYGALVQAEKERKLHQVFPKDELNSKACNYHKPYMLMEDLDNVKYRSECVPFRSDEKGTIRIDADKEVIAKWIIQTFRKIEPRTHLDTEFGLAFKTPLDERPISRDEVLKLIQAKKEKTAKS